MIPADPGIICFGEVLWDVFPTHSRIGGAPLNVAARLASFGHEVTMLSAVGDDEAGEDILKFLEEQGIDSALMKKHPLLPTGQVLVQLDHEGKATYEIVHPVAWDDIQKLDSLPGHFGSTAILVYGSLASRDARTLATLRDLLPQVAYKVFDLNLRPPHYEYSLLQELMSAANFVKFNDEEIEELSGVLGFKGDYESMAKAMADKFDLTTVCVTLGDNGALLLHQDQVYRHGGFPVKVKDTVGAGDSFLATLVSQLSRTNDPDLSLKLACAMGALVASMDGANPEVNREDLFNFLRASETKL